MVSSGTIRLIKSRGWQSAGRRTRFTSYETTERTRLNLEVRVNSLR